MENQHKLVKGYRDLSQAEIDLMNEVKGLEQQVGQLWQRVKALDQVDGRCVAHARTQLQDGFMWLVRGIAQPADPFVEKVEAAVEQDWVDLEKTRDQLMARILANKEMPVLGMAQVERLESQLAWVEKKLAERQPVETFYARLVKERG